MSQLDEEEDIDGVAFRWGKKRGVGGKKGVQFYESFSYDGIEYTLHDCVYLYKKGEPEPYIGKLVRIWATPDNLKEVEIHWFFRPAEISNWLGDGKVLVNEVFLAAGEGVGLANVNPLGAIAGKCNVVCISRDSRNPQPSEDDIKGAHYLFYRTFDVGQCTISDKMDDHVGGLEVKHVFNKGHDSIIGSPSLNSGKDAGKISVESSAIGNVKDIPIGSADKNDSGANANAADMSVKSGIRPNVSGDEANRNGASILSPTTSERKVNAVLGKGFVRTEKDLKCAQNLSSEDRPSKKVRFHGLQEVDAIGPANLMSKGKMISSCHLPNRKESREETDEKLTKSNQAKPPKGLARNFPAEGRSEGDMSSVSQRPSNIGNVKDAPLASREKNASCATAYVADMPVKSGKRPNVSGDEVNRNGASILAPNTSERKVNTVQVKGFVRTENELQCAKSVNSEDRLSKKVRFQEVDAIGSANPIFKGKMISTCHLPNRKESREDTDEKPTKSNHAKPPKELARNFPAEGRSEGDMSSVSQRSTDVRNVKDAPLGSGDKKASGANANAADIPVQSGKRPNLSGDEANRNGARILAPTTSERKVNTVQAKGFVRTENELKCAKIVNSEDRPSKKVRFQEVDAIGSANPMSKGKMISREETDEKPTKTNQAKPPKELARSFPAEGRNEGDMSSVSQRPTDWRSTWMIQRTWEEKYETECKIGTVVLLMNLDPAYSSGEVEDIIWHAFKEHSSARMLQHTMISSPHSGLLLPALCLLQVPQKISQHLLVI